MESEVGPNASSKPHTDHIVLMIDANATDEGLEALAEVMVDWIESVAPGTILPEEQD